MMKEKAVSESFLQMPITNFCDECQQFQKKIMKQMAA